MRVLHLPNNTASQITETVLALRDIGIEARGLAHAGHITSNETIETIPARDKRNLLTSLRSSRQRREAIYAAIDWADVIHWYCGPALSRADDVRYARRQGKKLLVEFLGADIRVPEIERQDNPYYAEVYDAGLWEYTGMESAGSSRRRQRAFARHGAQVLIPCPSLLPFVHPDLFPVIHRMRQRINLRNYTPVFPDPANKRPLVIHSPSQLHAKGTPSVLEVIGNLQGRFDFDFRLIHGVPYAEAQAIMRSCDVMVDQFVVGAHGVAALEAMALGKPVVCYIKDTMVTRYPPEMPIVNASKTTLLEVLAGLLADGERRRTLGEQGRQYVEQYHDAVRLAQELAEIYRQL
jgi:glycosyltransferase involved in cell wall biosynthesis